MTIDSIESAHAYLRQLYEAGRLYHPDDNAEEIIAAASDQPLFTPEEAVTANAQMALVFKYDPDPCGFCLTLINEEES